MPLGAYRKKRDFRSTPEPRGKTKRTPRARGLLYVIQKHAASRLHYDFRLELDGVLKSWAIPKGPSLDPGDKRLAVEVEDHPIEYGSFEGTIPKGQYGGGSVLLWDRGTWTPDGDARAGLRRGNLKFELQGEKLRGRWVLVRIRGRDEEDAKKNWLLIKERDPETGRKRPKDILEERPESVLSGRRIENVGKKVWQSNRPGTKREPAKRVRTPKPARALDPGSIPGARAAPLPSFVPPQLATLVSEAPAGEEWAHEIKYDGYRFLCRIDRGRARLLTRSGLDWTDRFPSVAEAAAKLPAERAILDGELVVLRPDGVSSFQDLQNAMRGGREEDLVFFVFDLLHLDGFDLTGATLLARKEALARLVASPTGAIRFSDHVLGQGSGFYREACRRKLEGIVSKRANAVYTSGRAGAWLKTKCSARQEFVIGGYTEPQGSRSHLGALLLGVTNGGNGLEYSGKVGTGFTQESLRDLERRLAPLQVAAPPFLDAPRMRDAHWVKPRLVAEVAFTGWTEDGKLRHPSFQGLREDKSAREVTAERAKRPPRPKGRGPSAPPARRRPPRKPPRHKPPLRDPVSKPPLEEPPPRGRSPVREPPDDSASASSLAGVRISHPGKILYPGPRLTKMDLARYLERVAPRMIPQIEGRPLMLVRCPEGQGKPCFYQKHPGPAGGAAIERLTPVPIREASGQTETYLTLHDAPGLVALLQMGALEIHVWCSRADALEKPDRVIFDLDPDPSVAWPRVVETAHRLRDRLAGLELESFVKTTGGKGIHVVVPLRRGPGWEDVKLFSSAIGMSLIREEPDRFTMHLSKARRGGKILIDTLRNRRGATWVAPYSPRAREGAPVSTPIRWEELTPKLEASGLNVVTVPDRLRRKDPWGGMESTRQTITASMLRALREAR